jgi:DNA-binding LacI/PurR family transcriptional regulator
MIMNSIKQRSSTIIEVAKLAGVSPATISRVLNGTATVAPETEQRVRAAIAALEFSPHPVARQLVMQRTNMIGVLLPEISGAFFSPMLKGIEAGARVAGYDLLIYSTQNGQAARPLSEHNTDGLIVFPEGMVESELRRYHRFEFPLVLLHQTPPHDCPYPFVTVENKSGAEMLINHLIEAHGRHRIVYLQGPDSHEDSLWRERGYRDALEAHGLEFDPELVASGGFDEVEAASAIENLLMDGVEFDAVFAGDDDAAAGVMAALKQVGRSVPEDVAVVGFDDVPFSRFLSPSLTTVRAPIEQVGREAVRLLVNCIQKHPCESEVLLPTESIIRQSCGCH